MKSFHDELAVNSLDVTLKHLAEASREVEKVGGVLTHEEHTAAVALQRELGHAIRRARNLRLVIRACVKRGPS